MQKIKPKGLKHDIPALPWMLYKRTFDVGRRGFCMRCGVELERGWKLTRCRECVEDKHG